MSSTEITIVISDQIAREAEAKGLLTSQSVEELLRAELRRRRVDQFFDAADRLSAANGTSLTEADVEAEITAARQQRRLTNESDR